LDLGYVGGPAKSAPHKTKMHLHIGTGALDANELVLFKGWLAVARITE
jgi:hypothetical protein